MKLKKRSRPLRAIWRMAVCPSGCWNAVVVVRSTASDLHRCHATTSQRCRLELIAKGRFDEVSSSICPVLNLEQLFWRFSGTPETDTGAFDLEQLALASAGFNGSELGRRWIGDLYSAFQEGVKSSRHLFDEFTKTRSLSVLMHEQITELA